MSDLIKKTVNLYSDDLEINMTKDFEILKVPSEGKVKLNFIKPEFRGKNGLVIFYNPKCRHCQDMQGDVAKVANMTKGLFPVGTINVENTMYGNNLLADYFEVTAYPTIKFYDMGEFIDYSAAEGKPKGRSVTDFMKFLCVKNGLCDLL